MLVLLGRAAVFRGRKRSEEGISFLAAGRAAAAKRGTEGKGAAVLRQGREDFFVGARRIGAGIDRVERVERVERLGGGFLTTDYTDGRGGISFLL